MQSDVVYRKRINAWCMYDWANSAFATTILAVILPIYYSQVAGATLPSEATATAYWSVGLSVSLLVVAALSPILGTVSDIVRSKKPFLSIAVTLGVVTTGLLVLVETGDWMMASLLFVFGRIGFTGANVFYDALLPHVAKPEDQDRVSARGFAVGYLGGGLLLAINVVMIQVLPGTWGPRLSFLSVAIWWAVFSIPLFVRVPEPPAATATLAKGETVIGVSFRRLGETLRDVSRYRQLFRFLVAYLIYNDGIGTIIGVAAIYGAELGFGSMEMILALLLVQFVGIPFSLIFGRLPYPKEKRKPLFLAFILFNMVMLPVVGLSGARMLPDDMIGAAPDPYATVGDFTGEGAYHAGGQEIQSSPNWSLVAVAADDAGTDEDIQLYEGKSTGDWLDLSFNGQEIEIVTSSGPDHGIWSVEVDGMPLVDEDGELIKIDSYRETSRYEIVTTIEAEQPGMHVLRLENIGEKNADSSGTKLALAGLNVMSPARQSNLLMVIGIIIAVEVVGFLFALVANPLFAGLASKLNTKNTIILALCMYAVISIWGYVIDSVIEFWHLAWMVAVVQGGSQALSRSLYAQLSPAAKSGEFFGLYGVMEKFSAVIGPLIFAAAATIFSSSRPAVLSLVVLFFLGIYLLTRVDVQEGRRVAQEEDAQLLQVDLSP